MKKVFVLLCLLTLILSLASCSKLPKETLSSAEERIQILEAKLPGTIPAEYGKLVGVTSSDSYPGWAQLWFEKEDKTIVVVAVNFITGEMRTTIGNIPRS